IGEAGELAMNGANALRVEAALGKRLGREAHGEVIAGAEKDLEALVGFALIVPAGGETEQIGLIREERQGVGASGGFDVFGMDLEGDLVADRGLIVARVFFDDARAAFDDPSGLTWVRNDVELLFLAEQDGVNRAVEPIWYQTHL